jgi:hypothetical protein
MPIFVHLAPEKEVKHITAHAIKGMRRHLRVKNGYEEIDRAVYCMPMFPGNFHITHQWLRELKRGGQRTMVGIYFALKSDEPVWVGHYNQPHRQVSAGEAIKILMEIPDAEGWEVIVPRSIAAKEIRKTRALPQTVGWRYLPKSHTTKPFCSCPYCIPPGSIKSRRLRDRLEATQQE